MKKVQIAILGLALLFWCIHDSQAAEWSPADTYREITYSTLLYVDTSLTKDAMERGGFKETNPLYGSHPSEGRLTAAWVLGSALHYGIATLFDDESDRRIFQYVTIGIEGAVVAHNLSMGLKVDF